MASPEAAVTNVFGNKFLSELCPINPAVRGYAKGLTKDLVSRGLNGIVAESLHFHGARHGEHHERFFIELSPVSEFLFSLCFCKSCVANYQITGNDAQPLINKVKGLLTEVFQTQDPWLGKQLSKDLLAEVVGPEILKYLSAREEKLAALYEEVVKVSKAAGSVFKLVDQAPLLDMNSANALGNSWQVGIDNQLINKIVDRYEPLVYRPDSEGVSALAQNYLKNTTAGVTAILRPTYPDSTSRDNLAKKVSSLTNLGISEIDFYLLDTMRSNDLESIKSVLN